MKKIVIYQIKKEAMNQETPCAFMGYKMLQQFGKFDFDNYHKTYEGERKDEYGLEDAFYEFNMEHPEDFKSYSLSVGDIIIMDNKASYIESCGFKTLLEW